MKQHTSPPEPLSRKLLLTLAAACVWVAFFLALYGAVELGHIIAAHHYPQ